MYNINDIVDKIFLEIKGQLNEGLSQRLFHFCPVSSMYSIAKTNSFKLTSINERPSDAKLTSLPIDKEHRKQYNYYMCFSRTPSSLVGYVSMRRSKTGGIWLHSLVRIEVDGDKLNSNYKGMPVNYFTDKNQKKINHYLKGKNGEQRETVNGNKNTYSKVMDVNSLDANGNIVKKEIQRGTPHADDEHPIENQVTVDYGMIDRNQMSEYEDRLFSNKEFINNIKERGIIKRIDIYLNNNILNRKTKSSNDILHMVDEIINFFGDTVHIFNNFSSFEMMNVVNSISGYNFKEKYLELPKEKYEKTHQKYDENSLYLLPNEESTIVRYATILAFYGFGKNWINNTIQNTLSILEDIGFYPFNQNDVIPLIEGFLRQIYAEKDKFFQWQTKILSKELSKFPPYKLGKYVSKLDEIRKIQEKVSYFRTGKKVNFLTIKGNYAKTNNKIGKFGVNKKWYNYQNKNKRKAG